MTCKVIGIQQVDFKAQSGDRVTGTRYHLINLPEGRAAEQMQGYQADNFFLSADKQKRLIEGDQFLPAVGDLVSVAYDRYGRPDFFFRLDCSDPFDV